MPQPGKQLQYTLPNISQSKYNETMKFGQVMEYNKKNIFLQKTRRKWGRETRSKLVFVLYKRFICGKSQSSPN